MRFRLKSKAIAAIVTMLLVCIGASMIVHYRLMKAEAVELRAAEIDATFERFLSDINGFTGNQGQKAAALATLGSWVYELEKQNASLDAPNAAMKLALSQLRTASDQAILGGGIWYEPYALEDDKKWVGPYAVVDGPGRAKPNWEYSTEEYAYSTHAWYTVAVPADWDRSHERMQDLYMTEPYMDSLAGRPTVFITFTHVMYSPDRHIIGVATADWTLDSLSRTLDEFRQTPSSFPVLVHAPSRKVLFPVGRDELSLLSDAPWGRYIDVDAATVGQISRTSGVVDGRDFDVMYTRTNADFVFGHFVATDEAYAFLDDIQTKNLWIAVVTLLLVAFATYVVVARLVGPIDRLAESARQIAAGDREHEAPEGMRDEIGELAEAFNRSHRRAREYAAELEKSADKLRKSEEHFRALIENSTDIIAVVGEDTTISYASPSVLHVLGYEPEDLHGKRLAELIRDADLGATKAACARLIGRRSPVESVELEMRHADGQWRRFEAVCTRHPEGVVFNARDVTERRAAEAALHRSEEHMRQVAKLEAVGRLAGGIAHDFNNAMTAVIGTCQVLIRRYPDDAKLLSSLHDILDAGEHASSLTRQLLTFSRHHVAERQAVDLNEVVRGVERMLRRLIGAHVELATDLDEEIPPVLADGREIEQVLVNLVVNARDALPDGGKIVIETRVESVAAPLMSVNGKIGAGEYCVLAVIDDGVGIDESTLPKIFDPFFSTKDAEVGTGLGLSTVYGIIKDSSGYILVDSQPSQGTRFQIFWSSTEQTVEREASARHTAARGHADVVLLAEDDERVRNVTAEVLRDAGFTVIAAADGVAALEVVRGGKHVDLLITDVVMPRMKGPQLAAEVAAVLPDLPVIFVSGYVAGELGADHVEKPHYDYLQKPFSNDRLVELARELIDESVKRKVVDAATARPNE